MTAARSRPIARPRTIINASIAQKVLQGWMRERHRTLNPMALDLRCQSDTERMLIVDTMALALDCVPCGHDRALAWLRAAGGSDADADALRRRIADPAPLGPLAERVRTANRAPEAYAACVGAIGRRGTLNRRYLDYVAARFGLSDALAQSLNRRYGA